MILIFAFFLLGAFSGSYFIGGAQAYNGNQFSGAMCVPAGYYFCNATSIIPRRITVQLGQGTGEAWSSVVFCLVSPSQNLNVSPSYCPGVSSARFSDLDSGQIVTVTFNDPTGRIIPLSQNKVVDLEIWALYTANNVSGDVQIGTLTGET